MGMTNRDGKAKPAIKDFYPLTPMQQGILFHSVAAANSDVYFEQFSWLIRGNLDISAFRRAWQHILERHEILRTGFVWGDVKEPVQVVYRQVPLPWQQLNWQHRSPVELQQQLTAFLESDRQQGFELKRPPLMRLTLIHLSEQVYHFTWSHHHLLLDGWSCATLVKEVVDCYLAFSHDQDVRLSPVRPYREYVVWLQQQDLSQAESFWRQLLKGFTAPTQLAGDRGVGQRSTLKGDHQQQTRSISTHTTAALERLTQQHRLTLNILIQGVWAWLLSGYSGQQDVVFGATTSGRPPALAKVESMTGLFINTLPVRLSVTPDAFLLPWLKQIQAQQTETRQYEYSSLVQVQGWSDVPRGFPLFESIVIFENYPVDASLHKLDLDLEFESFSAFEKTNYPLNLIVNPAEELLLKIAYDRHRFDTDTITRMLDHLQSCLERIVENPDQRLCELSWLTDTEQHQVLIDWNETKTDCPQNQCFHQRFAAQAEQTPDAIAVVFQDEQMTYGELNRRANQLAHYLQKLGVKPEVTVGLCVERSLTLIVALLGILKAGGAYLPLDPTYPSERLAFMLADSQVPLVLTTQRLAAELPQHQAQTVCLDADWSRIASESEQNPDCEIQVEHLAYLIYTSGSTGTPKGVLVTHEGLVNLTEDKIRICQVQPESHVLQFFSFSFDASIPEWVMSLGCGATLHLATPEDLLPSLRFVQLLREQAITHITLPPAALAALPATDLPALQMVLVGGEAPSAELIAQWSQGRKFINAYGPTETTVNASMVECGNGGQSLPTLRPAANKQLYILDRQLQPVPIGVPGELHIGGIGLARGYLNRPEKTAEAFIPNPFSHEPSRLYKTGDLACYQSDGYIKLLGRLDHQVKIRGFRIEPGEIETVLAQHPAVQDSVVIVREDQPGDKRLIAYLVTAANQSLPSTGALHRLIRQKLPRYMIPTVFVRLDALPLNPNGKIDRQALPVPDRPDGSGVFIAPRTPAETVLAQVFAQVLEVTQVGIQDDFFELGGHSLLATRLITRLLQTFQVELTIADLFEAPTVAGLAEQIERTQALNPSASAPVNDERAAAYYQRTSAFLKSEAVLEVTIRPAAGSTQVKAAPRNLFLTGATGFLGAFLLHELLQQTQAVVYCLVRANTIELAQQKLQDNLASYLLWQESFQHRIIPILGDLSEPLFGLAEDPFQALAETVDVIYHNGAWVHHTSPYSLLKATNVLGTQEVLRFACQTTVKPVHFMSTTSVFSPVDSAETQIIREQDCIDEHVPWGGYSQSKWVAEKLVSAGRERGIPISIYRLGRLSGHSQTGVFNQNDFLYRLIIGCVQLGSAPAEEMMLDMIPVDYASSAIVHLSKQEESQGKAFHFIHPTPVSSTILFETIRSLGYSVQSVSYDQWRAELLKVAEDSPDHALYPLVSLFPTQSAQAQISDSPPLIFDCQNTLNGLAGSSIICPPISKRLLHTYFSHLIQGGFLEPYPQFLE